MFRTLFVAVLTSLAFKSASADKTQDRSISKKLRTKTLSSRTDSLRESLPVRFGPESYSRAPLFLASVLARPVYKASRSHLCSTIHLKAPKFNQLVRPFDSGTSHTARGLQAVPVVDGSTAGTAGPQPVRLNLREFDSTAGYGTGRAVDTVPVAVRLTASTGATRSTLVPDSAAVTCRAATPRPGSALARLWLKPGLWVIFFGGVLGGYLNLPKVRKMFNLSHSLTLTSTKKAGAFRLGFGFKRSRPGQKQADKSGLALARYQSRKAGALRPEA
ncbi:hypothetical protein C8R46DRAFT_1037801 [Mycena filopes]|nr:hypothetical protein C8R46DRAFT_1037801 [Mycena filopes]